MDCKIFAFEVRRFLFGFACEFQTLLTIACGKFMDFKF